MVSNAAMWMISFRLAVLAHAPLLLLLISPFLILIGALLSPFRGRPYRLAALFVLSLGTLSLFFAGQPQPLTQATMATEPAAAAWTYHNIIPEARVIFTGLTLIYIVVLLPPEILRLRENRVFSTVLPLSFLILYAAAGVFLVQTVDSAAAAQTFSIHAASGPAHDSGRQLPADQGN